MFTIVNKSKPPAEPAIFFLAVTAGIIKKCVKIREKYPDSNKFP